jgi:flavodoxin
MNIQSTPRAGVIYESMFGNTERVAHAVAEGLRAAGYDVACRAVTATEPDTADDMDLLVLGAPTHAFSLSRPNTRADAVRQGAAPTRAASGLREWIGALPTTESGAPCVAIFDTRVTKVRRLPMAAGRTAAKLVRGRGYRLIGKPEPFLVVDTSGPLEDGEEERAERWGEDLGRMVVELAGKPDHRSASDKRAS